MKSRSERPAANKAGLSPSIGDSDPVHLLRTILNSRVSAPRLGHAYSVHGISGNLGWAVAPALMAGVTVGTGSWRYAASFFSNTSLLMLPQPVVPVMAWTVPTQFHQALS